MTEPAPVWVAEPASEQDQDRELEPTLQMAADPSVRWERRRPMPCRPLSLDRRFMPRPRKLFGNMNQQSDKGLMHLCLAV